VKEQKQNKIMTLNKWHIKLLNLDK